MEHMLGVVCFGDVMFVPFHFENISFDMFRVATWKPWYATSQAMMGITYFIPAKHW